MSKHPIAFAMPAVLLAGVIAVGHAAAQSPAGAFAGKTVNLIIGFGTGGGYDLWARVVGRHIGRHLPGNPTVTPQNMEGAGSYRAANFIYNVAPKDGTSIALISRDAPLGPLIGTPGAQFDATKLSWLGPSQHSGHSRRRSRTYERTPLPSGCCRNSQCTRKEHELEAPCFSLAKECP